MENILQKTFLVCVLVFQKTRTQTENYMVDNRWEGHDCWLWSRWLRYSTMVKMVDHVRSLGINEYAMFNWTINMFNLSRSTYIDRPMNSEASSSDEPIVLPRRMVKRRRRSSIWGGAITKKAAKSMNNSSAIRTRHATR